jgi:hypothetical protein
MIDRLYCMLSLIILTVAKLLLSMRIAHKYFIEKIKGVGIVLEATEKARRCGITMETAGTAKTGTEYEPS